MTLRPTSLTVLAPGLFLALAATAAEPEPPDMPDDGLGAPVMAMPMNPPTGVRRITDGALTCEQLYAESLALEAAMVKHRIGADEAQREASEAQQAVMQQAGGGMGVPVASSLLGMVPGGSMVGSLAAQAQVSSQRAAMQKGTAQMTAAYQRMAQAHEQLAHAQARNDHLVGLFLERKCKLPEGVAAPAR